MTIQKIFERLQAIHTYDLSVKHVSCNEATIEMSKPLPDGDIMLADNVRNIINEIRDHLNKKS